VLRSQGFQRVRIWPRGVDITAFRPEQRDASLRTSWLSGSDKVVMLYAGRVSWEKNLRLLIKAYQGMDHTNCHLVMVGDGPALREIKQELDGMPVTFTGYLQGEELARAYASADLFAFPSKTETFGQVVLEAMASGLPVVGLQAEGVCDIVEDGKSGLLLDIETLLEQEQTTAYRDLLTRLVGQHDLRRNMGLVALQTATRRTWDEAMHNLMLGYMEVLVREQPLVAA
jgi:glycosyltransferase involved in cell wall biosynthesis